MPAKLDTSFLRHETTAGKLLVAATAVALLWVNLDEASYRSFWSTHLDPGADWLHLDLTLAEWAADGLLAIFFFVAGLELKRELLVGELSQPRRAALPVIAAVGGMIVPAALALAVSGGDVAEGGAWAVPVATDIAFALGVLALAGAALPSGARALLLSIAVVDDLIAITLIAVVFTGDLTLAWLAGAAMFSTVYWLAFRWRLDTGSVLWLLALAAWICVHASGVHATVAGIVLGLLTPVRPRAGEAEAAGSRLEHRLHPVSAGLAVPLFALGASGVSLAALGDVPTDAVALGIFTGLLAGKVIGIFGGAWAAVVLRLGTLPARVTWSTVLPLSLLGGIGYTVSLLIAGLALDGGAEERAAAAVLSASVIASAIALLLLRWASQRVPAASSE